MNQRSCNSKNLSECYLKRTRQYGVYVLNNDLSHDLKVMCQGYEVKTSKFFT